MNEIVENSSWINNALFDTHVMTQRKKIVFDRRKMYQENLHKDKSLFSSMILDCSNVIISIGSKTDDALAIFISDRKKTGNSSAKHLSLTIRRRYPEIETFFKSAPRQLRSVLTNGKARPCTFPKFFSSETDITVPVSSSIDACGLGLTT